MLRRRKTQETLLIAGGQWDHEENHFTNVDPEFCKIVDLEESQVEFTRWYAKWLEAFRLGHKRDVSLAVAGGDRRGGKTFDLLLCTVAAAIDVPLIDNSALVGWSISCNYQERDELDRTIREVLPASWYAYRKAPEFRYTFAHGSTIRNVSADDPETLKRGRVDVAFLNEGQKIPVGALSNAIYGTVDKAGICLIACNPPRRQVGEWILNLKEAIGEGQVQGAKFFGFSAKDNTRIEQGARGRIGNILRVIDPRAAQADDEGAWLPVGNRAYPRFERKRHAVLLPDIGNITDSYTRRRIGRAYDNVAGVDFQGVPHHAAVILRVYGQMARPIYCVVGECVAEQSTEDDLLDEIDDMGFSPENLFWVGDASGQYQDGKHTSSGRGSFDIFKARRWHIQPPKKKKSARGEWSKNPHISDRLNLVARLLEEDRIRIDPVACPRLVEAMKECPLKQGMYGLKPCGRFAHITDALGYALFYLEPRPTPIKREDQVSGGANFEVERRGSNYI